MLYIILAILMFGLLIAVHEFGHFVSAKLFGIQVNEFSIGMGPALWKKRKGETLYSLRVLPIGGYCAMEGEDEKSSNPRAFGNAAAWKQLVVLAGGAAMNFLTGLLILLILYAPVQGFRIPVYSGAEPGYGAEDCGLQPGDRFLSVDGHRVLVYGNVPLYLNRAGDRVDLVVERNGEKFRLDGVYLPYQTRVDENGNETQGDQHRLGGGPAHGGQQASLCLEHCGGLYPHGVAQPWRAGPGCGGPAGSVRPSGDREYHVSGGEPVAHSC